MSKIIILILFSVISTYAHAKTLNETHVVPRHHASRPLAEHPVVEIQPRDHHLLNATIKHIEHNTTQHLIKKEINLRKLTEMVVNVKHNLTHFFHNIHHNSSLVGKHENVNKTREPTASPSIFEITREKISNFSQSFKTIDFSKGILRFFILNKNCLNSIFCCLF